MFSASEIFVIVGGICVIVGFFWILGLVIGLRLRGKKVPLKGICAVFLLAYLVAAAFAAQHVAKQLAANAPSLDGDLGTIFDPVNETHGHIVTRVVDGDTIVVDTGPEEVKVRILGINTPETVDPNRDVECFGPEASARAEELLEGQEVTLTPDITQGSEDRYGRLLRYVALVDGTDVGELLIEEGYAFEYTYEKAYERQAEYRAAEDTAKSNEFGIWSELCQK